MKKLALAIVLLLTLGLAFQAGRFTEQLLPLFTQPQERPTLAASGKVTDTLPLSPADRVQGLSTIWEQAKYNYPFWHRLPDLDWDRAYREYIPRVLAAEDDLAYYHLLQEFVALLKDGHSTVQLPAALSQQLARPELRLVPVGEELVVAAVGSALLDQGIKPGAILTHVDGQPVAVALSRVKPRVAASTPQDLLEGSTRPLLMGPIGSEVALTFGNASTVTVQRAPARAQQGAAPLTVKDLGDGIHLVTIATFNAKEVVPLFNKAFPSFKGVKGLIFDVRENGGGSSSYGDAIIKRMIRLPILTSRWQTRQRMAAFSAWGRGERWYGSPSSPLLPAGLFGQYGGKVIVLTSPRTYSAAEDFTMRLKASGRATVVGQPTGGSTGQPILFPLPGGGMGRVLTKWDKAPDGTEFVGVGIKPDVTVEPTAQDYAAGNDPVLAKALELLRK